MRVSDESRLTRLLAARDLELVAPKGFLTKER